MEKKQRFDLIDGPAIIRNNQLCYPGPMKSSFRQSLQEKFVKKVSRRTAKQRRTRVSLPTLL